MQPKNEVLPPKDLLLTNADILHVEDGSISKSRSLRLSGGRIVEIGTGHLGDGKAEVIDLKGRVVMPGLIDAHVHILGELAHVADPNSKMRTFQAILGAKRLLRMLRRGFTTVRDAGGADAGYRSAVAERAMPGPRIFISGHALSPTGGHGDKRSHTDLSDPCGCVHLHASFGRVCDGVPNVLTAARDEIRLGADQIKIVASGGVGSTGGTLHTMQFSDDEIRAVVDEAARSGTYVMAHVYSSEGVKRLVRLGVRSIEHGNLIEDDAARMIAEAGAFLVPNLVAYDSISKYGRAQGYPESARSRLEEVLAAGARSLDIARRAGVKIGFGSDLVKDPESQSNEFTIRAEIMKPIEIIQSATLIGAEIVRMEGQIGTISVGAIADLIAVDGNPLEKIDLLTGQGASIPLIIKDGYVEKTALEGDFDRQWSEKTFGTVEKVYC
ncbi:MAG: amidohydrolase family protein [Alphaproteobacteria bacterium]|nr:amidohydrolase family protein [Alphaproteobacteria bacterium]